jgi:hypothetical protein
MGTVLLHWVSTAGVTKHRSSSNQTGHWSDWDTISDAVEFICHPALLQIDNDPRVDTNYEFWRIIWSNQTGYSKTGKIQGMVLNSVRPA